MLRRPRLTQRLINIATQCLAAVAMLALMFSFGSQQEAFAQSHPRIVHQILPQPKGYAPGLGRDLWFSMCQNYEAGGANGKYYMLYVTSPNTTTVNIQVTGSSSQKFPITAGKVVAFKIPLGWEVTSSGVIEKKAIRVWSDDADLTAYLLSRNTATSDGMFIIPSIGWGKEYVVAGYGSLFEGGGTFVYDYPSEFSLVANQDNTTCNVIPTQDIRKSGQPNVVLHQKGVAFSEAMMRGDCIQYQLTQAQNTDDYDVTGSIVTSNNPVGVVGASQCPNIPPDYPYCDHICDMIPPVRTWAKTYYSAPFVNRHGGDSFLTIASKDGQTIWRDDPSAKGRVHAILTKYQPYFINDITLQTKWYSDAPFLLVQYINSTTFGTGNDGIGDPAMVVVNSVEQFTPDVIFQTPTILSGQSTFQNFVNVVVNTQHVNSTTFDGIRILGAPGSSKISIDGIYEVYRINNLKAGTHTIHSDTGIGCYVYGYGSYDSYAWSGALGTRTFNDPDTIPPTIKTPGDCFCAHISAADVHPLASKLSSFVLDTIANMIYTLDPTFVPGSGRDSSFYDICVRDSSLPAYIQITVVDIAGNRTLVRSTYNPQIADITPPVTNFGTGTNGTKKYQYVTLTNTGLATFTIDILKLKHTLGFIIDSANQSPLKPGESRLIKISFEPSQPQTVQDTIVFGDACVQRTAIVVGNGGAPDFTVTDDDFGCILAGDSIQNLKVTLTNPSPVPVTIDSVWTNDPAHFVFIGTLPIVLNVGLGVTTVPFRFKPDVANPRYTTMGHFRSTGAAGTKTDSLFGCAFTPTAGFFADSTTIIDCPATGDISTFRHTITSSSSKGVTTVALLVQKGDPNFGKPSLQDAYGKAVAIPHDLSSSDNTVYVTEDFNVPANKSGTYRDTITVFDSKGNIIKQGNKDYVVVTAIMHYRAFNVNKASITYPTALFGSGPEADNFQICNTADDTLTVNQINQLPGPYKAAFTITSTSVGLPAKLAKGECMTVNVSFDPAKFAVDSQFSGFGISTDGCISTAAMPLSAMIRFGQSNANGFAIDSIFACSNKTDQVSVYNGNHPGVFDTIVSVTLTSGGANFTPTGSLPISLDGGETVQIPVLFTPDPAGGVKAYSGVVAIRIRDSQGRDTTLFANVSGSGIGMNANVSSVFAVKSAVAGASIQLPITITVTKNGLVAPLTTAGIVGVRLNYHYNQDRLDIANGDIANAVTGTFGDWSVDKAASSLNQANQTLTIVMKGTTPLSDGVTSLGNIHFNVKLTKNDSAQTVSLDSAQFTTATGAASSSCLGTTVASSDFALIYQCGDSSVQAMMNGKFGLGQIAKPVTPNPATASQHVVKFTYATRINAPVKLSIFDVLGNEVAIVVNNVVHAPGVYEAYYDTSKLPSGTYTYHLSLPGWAGSKQMVISK
jgi:hypothetical protein